MINHTKDFFCVITAVRGLIKTRKMKFDVFTSDVKKEEGVRRSEKKPPLAKEETFRILPAIKKDICK